MMELVKKLFYYIYITYSIAFYKPNYVDIKANEITLKILAQANI